MRILTVSNVLILAACAAATAQTPAGRSQPAKQPAPAAAHPADAAKTPAPVQPGTLPAADVAPTAVVLVVGDQKITRAQFEQLVAALPEQMRVAATGPNKRKFAEQFAEMKSLAYEAHRRKIDETPEFQQLATLQKDNLLASKLYESLNSSVKVDEAAERAYYDQHKGDFEEVKASHILIRFKGSPVPLKKDQKDLTEEEALAKAKEIREKLLKGGDFAALAKAESDDAGSGANGGSLGTFGHGRMVPQFEQEAFKLPVGQLSEPVKSQFGYHIIKVEERTEKKFEDVKGQIEARMKPEMARKAVEDVRKTVPVTIDDQYFGK